MKILFRLRVLQPRSGSDRGEAENVIRAGLVRNAEDGTAILDFGSSKFQFPRVRLRDWPINQDSAIHQKQRK